MISGTKYFPAYEISKEKDLKIQALMGFKPMAKYFTASEISEKKAYKIRKRADGLSKEKACNILAFMGFTPMISETKYFPAYEISKEKALKIQALEFKPMPNYFTGVQNVKEEPKKN